MLSTRSVLIVEDDAGIRHVLREVLIDEGYEVREAGDGEAALQALADWTPGAIILDLMMPGMDAWAFRSQQRSLGRALDVPVVLLSASSQLGDMHELAPAAIVAKPFQLDEIVSVVASVEQRAANA